MPKGKADIEIGRRAADFVDSMPGKDLHSRLRRLWIPRSTYYEWRRGSAPTAIYLERLARHGADVYYILTGKRIAD